MASAPVVYCGYNPVYAEYGILDLNADPDNAAGVYTLKLHLPKNSYITDIIVIAVALWNAGTTASAIVGDAGDPDGFYTAVNLKATDLVADEALSFANTGGQEGAYLADSATHWTDRYTTASRIIIMELTTVGTALTTGETHMIVLYARRPEGASVARATYVAT